MSVRMPASARTRNVSNDAVSAATMLPTTIAGDRKSTAINTAHAAQGRDAQAPQFFCQLSTNMFGDVRAHPRPRGRIRQPSDAPGSDRWR
jgi:hypothetical protein